MKKQVIVGIDTSNYTTSVAVITTDGELLANIKRPLAVKEGERGLRQSDAVFSHIKNLPDAMQDAGRYLKGCELVALGVSDKPRNIEGSYMPCFLSGVAAAEAMAASTGSPLYKFSHQCGHIAAALFSSKRVDLFEREFCAFHVSGGTTEVLHVKPDKAAFCAELVGGTADLNAGQLIDRVGVFMGLPFPAGPHVEQLALKNSKRIPRRIPKLSSLKINLSGAENIASKLYTDTNDKSLVSAFLLEYVGNALVMLAESYEQQFGKTDFVFAGGVMSNTIIKARLSARFDAEFAEPKLSADNAVGIAYLALRAYKAENN